MTLTALFTLFSILRTPSFQELAGRIAAGFLSNHLNSEVYLERIRLSDFLLVTIEGLQVNDHHSEKMLVVEEMRIGLNNFSLKGHRIDLGHVSLDSGAFFLRRYPEDSLLNLAVFVKAFGEDTTAGSSEPAVWMIACEELTLTGFTFGLKNGIPDTISGMNFDDLYFSDIFVDIDDISVTGDSIAAFVNHVACMEKSGLGLLNFSGDATVSSSGIRVHQAQISTGQTSLDLDLEFLYTDYSTLSYFLDSVMIRSDIRSSLITMSDIGYFAPLLASMGDPVMFAGSVKGSVSDFEATDLRINLGEFTQFLGSVQMVGLPDFNSTWIRMDIDRLSTMPEDIRDFDLPIENQDSLLPPQVMQMGLTTVTGFYEGLMSDFKTQLKVNTDVGSVNIKGSMSENNPDAVPVFAGEVNGVNIHIGSMLGIQDLGIVNLEMEFEGKVPADSAFELDLNGWLTDLSFREHSYEKIIVGGKVRGESYSGRLIVEDSSANLAFNGLVDFNGLHPVFDFSLDLENIFLENLRLSDRGSFNNLSGKVEGRFTGMDTEAFYGEVSVDDLIYFEDNTKYALRHFELSRTRNGEGLPDSILIRSDYVDMDAEADFVLMKLVSQLQDMAIGNELDEQQKRAMEQDPQFVNFNIKIKDASPITDLFLPDLELAPETKISGIYNSAKHSFQINGFTEKLSVSGIDFEQVSFNGNTVNNMFYLDLGVDRLVLQEDEDGNWMGIEKINSSFVTGKDSIEFLIKWDNLAPENLNKGEIEGYARIDSVKNIFAGIYRADATFDTLNFRIEEENLFAMDTSSITLKNFKLFAGDQFFAINGKLSDRPTDTLSFSFHQWSLANFNPLLERFSLLTSGNINGRLGVFRNHEQVNFFAGIGIRDFSFNDVYFGDAELKTRWFESDKALATDLNIYSKSSTGSPFKILGLNGYYYPFDHTRNFDFDIVAQNLNISVLEPFLKSFSSHIDGFASGKLTLDGTNAEPLLLGKLKLQRAEMKVDYLNVIYSFANEVVFKKGLIQFNELTVFDPNSNTALLTGGLEHDYFNDMRLDLTIKPDNFMAMDLNRYQNEVFYGKAFATGTVRLSGPLDNLLIDVDVKTDKNTQVSIPINYSVDVSQTDFIIFTGNEEADSTKPGQDLKITGVSLDFILDVTREADIEIFLPGNIGNIRAKGDGKLRLGVDPNGYLRLNGSYIIRNGLFVFSLEQLVSRRFDILEGSNISWTGDIYDAEVNIVARYRLRTSLEGLGISMIDPDAASQKVIVFTDIRMSGNLFNPDLTFGITFPNIQEQTRQAIYAVLDTNDMGIMNQQAISLLVLGSFSATGTGGTNPVNPAAIVSSTLSNMLSQISNDFNIGINYVPGDQVSSEQLEVALSTQLLDDRLIIDGNIDVSGTNDNSQKTSSIVGDINIEYKLTPDGRFRVKAFNRSNDLTLFNDYAPYTQGVGIFYRKEFDNIHELFKKSSKRKQPKQ